MSRDILDAFGRRHGNRQFHDETLPKLNLEEKLLLAKELKRKIIEIQKELDRPEQIKKSDEDNLKLSQMSLMWIYDQVTYGKL